MSGPDGHKYAELSDTGQTLHIEIEANTLLMHHQVAHVLLCICAFLLIIVFFRIVVR